MRSTQVPTSIHRGQSTREMHMSCYQVLQTVIAKVTGKSMFALLRPPPTGEFEFLYIDPVAVMMTNGQWIERHNCHDHRTARQL